MRAAIYRQFGQPIHVETVPDPEPAPHGVVVEVKATGLCRSDWHGWMGHDDDIELPHVPGHELAGTVAAIGSDVTRWRVGDRVTVPFVCACGTCPQCAAGHQQVCDAQSQPGFTHWGSFAEYVRLDRADVNLVKLPASISFNAAASLGCRFITAFRAVVDQGQTQGGQWIAVHGCGGVGLSAIMIAHALGAQIVAIDINDETLAFARQLGAAVTINALTTPDVVGVVRDATNGGVHVSLDALGSTATCFNSIANLRKRGKHIQVGLMLADERHPQIPMAQVIANELEIYGSHGMQAHRYPEMLAMIAVGQLAPEKLLGRTVDLAQAAIELPQMNQFGQRGVTVIDRFDV